jgi:hypothetical protein
VTPRGQFRINVTIFSITNSVIGTQDISSGYKISQKINRNPHEKINHRVRWISIPCMQPKILPRSEVGVANTRTPLPAIVKIPTVFSGLDYQFSKKNKNKNKVNHKIVIRYIQCAHITKKRVYLGPGFWRHK